VSLAGWNRFFRPWVLGLTRFVLWFWLVVGLLGVFVAIFDVHQPDRLEFGLMSGTAAAIGGLALLVWRRVTGLVAFSRGKLVTAPTSGEEHDGSQ
jgi:nitrate reductase gamma subunit